MEEQKIEDKMLGEIEAVFKKYKESREKDSSIDYRNFAAHDVLSIISRYCVIPEEGELPPKGWVKEKYQYIVTEAQEHMLKAGYGKYRRIEINA